MLAISQPNAARQTLIGLTLAASIIGGWLALHVVGVFYFVWTGWTALLAIPMVALETWLGAGMFIVAHDAMHGSLAPSRPRLNTAIGQIAVGLYAAFDYRKLNTKHHEHHRWPGEARDPDFHPDRPTAFLAWFVRFFTTYFGWAELARLAALLFLYLVIFRVSPLNAAVFWGLPALLSAVQLFTFGTWLPHRHASEAFADRHWARTLDYPWLLSLATCFHFGLHHEHHLTPREPWWRLPAVRRGGVS